MTSGVLRALCSRPPRTKRPRSRGLLHAAWLTKHVPPPTTQRSRSPDKGRAPHCAGRGVRPARTPSPQTRTCLTGVRPDARSMLGGSSGQRRPRRRVSEVAHGAPRLAASWGPGQCWGREGGPPPRPAPARGATQPATLKRTLTAAAAKRVPDDDCHHRDALVLVIVAAGAERRRLSAPFGPRRTRPGG